MKANSKANHSSGWNSTAGNSDFAYTGNSMFMSATAGSSGSAPTNANTRSTFSHGYGVYDAFFNKTQITKVALVNGNGDLSDPTSNTRYLVYDLVGSTGTESFYDIIKRLDAFNRNNSNWAGSTYDGYYSSDSVTNFTKGKSGSLVQDSGHYKCSSGNTPSSFCIWGINNDSDNDTQVLCAYSGNLTSGKGDSWRGNNPQQTFWSYWGNDWHSNSQQQTISVASQTSPGWATNASYYLSGLSDVFLIAC